MRFGERTRSGTRTATWVQRPTAGVGYGVATGGTAISPDPVIDGVTYRVLQFTSTGTLTVTKAGLFDVLCIGGGGSGSGSHIFGAGGAGGFQTNTLFIDATLTVTVGGGGGVASSTCGGTSRIGNLFSVSGGGSCDTCADTGLCGASTSGSRTSGGAATRNNIPGQGTGGTTQRGGCGAGAASTSDTGGVGKEVNTFIGGSSLVLANGASIGAGAGGTNTGNGGGNGSNAGGSGIVYVRFKV